MIRNYHGHLSGIYSIALHPTLDVLMTGGRDAVCRVWDMRTKVQVHCLSGHDDTVCSILSQGVDPQARRPLLCAPAQHARCVAKLAFASKHDVRMKPDSANDVCTLAYYLFDMPARACTSAVTRLWCSAWWLHMHA